MRYELDYFEELQAEIDRLKILLDIKDRQKSAARAEAIEEAAQIAGKHQASADAKFNDTIKRGSKGEKILELAAATAAGMSHASRKIGDDIRALMAPKSEAKG